MNKKILFFLFIPFMGLSQTQIGSDIVGEFQTNEAGTSVSISANGSIVAIGAPRNIGGGNYSGNVRIFQNVSGVWSQLGNSIQGKSANDKFGTSVSLSSDGSIVAIGAPYNDDNGISYNGAVSVYKNVSGIWNKIGNDIIDNVQDLSGVSVALSSDGSVVAIGSSYGNDLGPAGNVSVYENISGNWSKIGNTLTGSSAGDMFGNSVAISDNGSIVAIGANTADGNGLNSGSVSIYQNVSGNWVKIGADIYGEFAGDDFGTGVSLSADGSIVAVGAPENDGNGSYSGHVKIFKNISGSWTQIGADIEGEYAGDRSGLSVSLSSDGTILVIGNRAHLSYVRLYKYVSGNWIKLGNIGKYTSGYFGYSISLSSNGDVLAVGIPLSDANGTASGSVKVYNLVGLLSSDHFVLENFNIYPNPTSDVLNISLENDLILKEVIIYNSLGQIVKKSNKTKIDVSSLSKGMYHAEVKTDKGKASKKIIIK